MEMGELITKDDDQGHKQSQRHAQMHMDMQLPETNQPGTQSRPTGHVH